MSIILLTGYRGFIGSAVLDLLMKDDSHQIIVLGRQSDTYQNLPSNISPISVADVFDGALKSLEIDVVVNCANSYENTSLGENSPLYVNYLLPVAVLETVVNRAKHFINLDTSLNKSGSHYHARPYYSLSKKHFRDYLVHMSSQICVSNLVCEHVYGENSLRRPTLLSELVLRGVQGTTEEMRMTKGEQVRDFIYVKDVAKAVEKVIQSRVEKIDLSFVDFEVGTGMGMQISQLANLVEKKLNVQKPFTLGLEPYRDYEVMYSVADISLLQTIGWFPSVDLSAGLDLLIEYARNHYNPSLE